MPEIVLEGKAADAAKVAGVDEAWLERVAERAEHAETLRRVVGGSAALIAVLVGIIGFLAVNVKEVNKAAAAKDVKLRNAWRTNAKQKSDNLEQKSELDAANKVIASNHLVPKRLDALAVLNKNADHEWLDLSGRNRIAIAIFNDDLAEAVYWFGRGTKINQPRYGGRWTHDADGNTTGFERDLTRTGRSPMQIAAMREAYVIIKYFLRPDIAGKVDWDYSNDNHHRTVRDILARKKREAGENAPPILDEILIALSML